jgi:hypothetical protein
MQHAESRGDGTIRNSTPWIRLEGKRPALFIRWGIPEQGDTETGFRLEPPIRVEHSLLLWRRGMDSAVVRVESETGPRWTAEEEENSWATATAQKWNKFPPKKSLGSVPIRRRTEPNPSTQIAARGTDTTGSQEKGGETDLAAEGDALDVDRHDGAAGVPHPRRRACSLSLSSAYKCPSFTLSSCAVLAWRSSTHTRSSLSAGVPSSSRLRTGLPIFAQPILCFPVIATRPPAYIHYSVMILGG